MDAIRCLCEEHDLILMVLDRLEDESELTRKTGRVDRGAFEQFLEFFGGFTAEAHFCKEEHGLFPMLQDHGVPRDGSPLAALEQKHKLARSLLRDFSDRLESADHEVESTLRDLLDTGARLVELLRGHLARADHCMFGMASGLLKDQDPGKVERIFCAAERRVADEATLRR